MTVILFWDIDGTLLTTGRAGIFAWEEAAAAILGRPVDFASLETAGLTDIEIGGHILARMQGDASCLLELVRAYETALPRCLPRRQGSVLPGVRPLLDHLRTRADVLSLLLTGNTAAGAGNDPDPVIAGTRALERHPGGPGFGSDSARSARDPDLEVVQRERGRTVGGLAAGIGAQANAQRAWRELQVGTVKINAVWGGAPGGSADPRRGSGLGLGYGPGLLREVSAQKVVHMEPAP